VNQDKPSNFYNKNIHLLALALTRLERRHIIFGSVKIFWFIIGLPAMFQAFPLSRAGALAVAGACFVGFVITAVLHESVLQAMDFNKRLRRINQNELELLQLHFPEDLDTGEEFRDREHRYSSDLDIFGQRGLFHFINRAATAGGRQALAQRLKSQADAHEAARRREAIKELALMTDLRRNAAAHGLNIKDSTKRLNDLRTFLAEPFLLMERKGLILFMYLWPTATLASLVSIFFGGPFLLFFGLFCGQMIINAVFLKRVNHIYRLTTKSHGILKAYSAIIEALEQTPFQSSLLNELKERLVPPAAVGSRRASQWIQRLSSLLGWFDTRNGAFHFFLTNILFWDLHCMLSTEKWRKQAAPHVEQWFNVIAGFEELSSFAALAFNHPHWVYPEFHDGPFVLQAKAVGHPLIPEAQRICNDACFGGKDLNSADEQNNGGNVLVVTGPNMAGKSTFLRTIGTAAILAFAGAPVCAEKFRISPVQLFTSMQSSDSLDKHMSLFYAELERLKIILDGIAAGEPVFFIIDEMLKGTNALDRQKGAVALVKQLVKNKADGIVATHDLELTRLGVDNYHFDGYIENDKLLFDYLLKKGTCQSFNALALMKIMGIDV